MTIGQRKSFVRSSIRAPKFLDKSSGFYGRLDEMGSSAAEDLKLQMSNGAVEDMEIFNEGDGEMLLRRKASRRSSRWRSLRGKDRKEERRQSEEERGQSEEVTEVIIQVQLQFEERDLEEADDQVLLRGRTKPEEQEVDRHKREQEEGHKARKRKSSKNYRKALDRVFRRGWEAFITNLYSVTLTPSAPDSSPSSPMPKKRQHSCVVAEMH